MSAQNAVNAPLDEKEPGGSSLGTQRTKLLSLLLLGMAVFVFIIVLVIRTGQATPPGESSPEAGFARDMMVHHNQAVQMALYLYGHTDDTELNQLALDIILTQQNQIGQMQGWLALWDLPFGSTQPAMTWMGSPTTGLMPGMATPEQMAQLAAASGVDLEKQFLQLMIAHHQGGIHMASEIFDRTKLQAIKDIANSIINSQQAEVELMTGLLSKLDGTSS